MSYEMTIRDLILSIKNTEKDCKTEGVKEGSSGNFTHQKTTEIDYEKFYNKVKGIIELADEVTRPRSGGYCG